MKKILPIFISLLAANLSYAQQAQPMIAPECSVLVVYYSSTGNTKKVAELIAKKTSADVYEIKTSASALKLQAVLSSSPSDKLKLEGAMPDFTRYDIVFVGSPIWAHHITAPVLSFIKQNDFAGKIVVPFTTNKGAVGDFHEVFAASLSNGKPTDGHDFAFVADNDQQGIDDEVTSWLSTIIPSIRNELRQ
jgi:flavodoxin